MPNKYAYPINALDVGKKRSVPFVALVLLFFINIQSTLPLAHFINTLQRDVTRLSLLKTRTSHHRGNTSYAE